MPRVPERWFNYSRYGRPVADKFVALRVPLAKNYAIPDDQRFTPADAMSKLPLGLIIDLTNTTRYYNPCEFTSQGVEYQKLFVKGHAVPEMSTVRRFNSIVNGFYENASSGGKLIGVHCTHGLNRTGYLVCAYLILEQGYSSNDAITLFNRQRGHKMERANYLESLHSFSTQSAANGVVQPPQPHGDRNNAGTNRLQLVGKFRNNGVCGVPRQNERFTGHQDEPAVSWRRRDTRHQDERVAWRQGGRDTNHQDERVSWRQGEPNNGQERGPNTRHQGGWNTRNQGERDTRQQVERHAWQNGERRDTRYEWKRNTADRNHHRDRKMPQIPSIGRWDPTTRRIAKHTYFPEDDEKDGAA
uniref:Uncharacterized protein n=1 Tax=Anopheles atroparvus TaxID=41427 RepID=A0A182IRD5_ANOAO